MDESLADRAVRARCATAFPGRLVKGVGGGKIILVFAFGGSMHDLWPEGGGIVLALRAAGRQGELPSWVVYYQLSASDWPGFRAAVREVLRDGPLSVAGLGAVLTRRRACRHLKPVFDEGGGTLIRPLTWQGDMSLGPLRGGQLTFQRVDPNPRWRAIPDVDTRVPARSWRTSARGGRRRSSTSTTGLVTG